MCRQEHLRCLSGNFGIFAIMKLLVTIMFFFMFAQSLLSQTLKEYFIYCNPDDFDYIYLNYEEDIYVPISLKYNGVIIDNAEMRIRGDGSRALPKKSLKVKLNGTTFSDGISTFNFNAEYEDKSYIQQYVTSRIFKEAGHYCFNTEHVRLYLNDVFLGLYLSVENMDEDFLTANGLDADGTLYKASVDGSSLSIYDNVYYHWESKADDQNFDDLIEFINLLNNTSDEDYYEFANTVLDYDKMVNIIAVNLLLRNYSTYYHNYFMYHDINNSQKWTMLPWDLDKMFLYYEYTYPYHHTSKYWAPDNPYLERAIICDPIFEDIKLRVDELHNSLINNNYITGIIDSLEIVLEQSVIEDNTDNIQDVAEWHTKIQSGKSAFDVRYNNLVYQFNNYARSFNVHRTDELYELGEDIKLVWHSTEDPNGLSLTYSVYYGANMDLDNPATTVITNVTDTSYTIPGNLSEGKYYWKIVAKTSAYSIEGFDNYNFFYVISDIPSIVINEIFYKSDDVFNSGDWVELYNNSLTEVDLSNWTFQDENDDNTFVIPEGTIIAPNDYLVLCNNYQLFNYCFPNVENVIGDMTFGFDSKGELLRLKHREGNLIDYVMYDSKSPWPVFPNGYGYSLELISPDSDNALPENWQSSWVNFGTPGRENSNEDSIEDDLSNFPQYLICYPNPFSDLTNIGYFINKSVEVEILICNSKGQKIASLKNGVETVGIHKFECDLRYLKNGTYFIQMICNQELTKTIKIVKI